MPQDFSQLAALIQQKVRAREYRLTLHAERERAADRITIGELEGALLGAQCEVIENYPDDSRGPSCLVLGFTRQKEPVHFVCGISSVEEMVVFITMYRPSSERWIDWRVRKK